MQNSMVMFTFSVFDWNCPSWVNLVQKIKVVNLSWNLVPTQIIVLRIEVLVSLRIFFAMLEKYILKLLLISILSVICLFFTSVRFGELKSWLLISIIRLIPAQIFLALSLWKILFIVIFFAYKYNNYIMILLYFII